MDYGENGGKVEITNPITNTWDEPLMMMVVDSKYQMKSLGFTTGGIIGSDLWKINPPLASNSMHVDLFFTILRVEVVALMINMVEEEGRGEGFK